MNTRRPKALDEAQFLNAFRDRAERAFSTADSNMSGERMEVMDHYQGALPKPFGAGSSKYVSRDVWDGVEAFTANLQEAFAAGNNIVQFSAVGSDDVSQAAIATALVEHVLWRQNDGFEIFGDVIKDAALTRTGFAKVFWEPSEETEEMPFEGSLEQFEAVLMQPGIELDGKAQQAPGPEGIIVKATLTRVVDTSQCRVVPVPPEEVTVTGRTRDLKRVPSIHQRTVRTLGELVDAGYPEDKVYAINEGATQLEFNDEAQRRHEDVNPGSNMFLDDSVDEAGRMVLVYESYMKIDREGTGRQSLWKVVHAGDVILEAVKVNRHPFVAYNPLPTPHRFAGENFAEAIIPMANIKTTMVRGVTDHLQSTVYPRYLVQSGAIKTPRQLLEQKRGGLIEVDAKGSVLDAIAPMPHGSLNPFIPQLIEQMDVAKEATTGTTRLAQGINKDALSNQNSGAMVNEQIGVSQIRTKVAARRFAIQFLKELVLAIYEIILENEKAERIFEVAGEFVQVSPAQWRSRRDVSVDLNLGYGERDRSAEELLTFDKIMTSSPTRLYGETQRYAVLKKMLTVKGHKDIQNFLVDPKTLQPEQPDPKSIAELEKLKAETAGLTVDQQIKQLKVQHDQQLEAAQFSYKQQLDALEARFKDRELARKDRELDNRIDISVAELELAAATFAEPGAEKKSSAIISPNS